MQSDILAIESSTLVDCTKGLCKSELALLEGATEGQGQEPVINPTSII